MTARDPHRFVNELDEATVESLINRLERRAGDSAFTRLRDAYLDKLKLPPSAHVLDLGCGTGVVARALAGREGFSGRVIGIDHSPRFIDAARRLAADEAVDRKVVFQVGDAHGLDSADGRFDAVIAHTLISHVTDPLTILKEAARVTRAGGMVAIFDGDYASLTYAYPDRALGKAMDEGLVRATFNNPLVMRELPRLLPQAGLELEETRADVVAEVGTGSYFVTFAETYAPMVSRAGLLSAETVDMWLREQRRAVEQGTFFAACNYYTYLARRGKTA